MSILINRIKMPKNCLECWNCDRNFNDRDLGDIDDWMCLIKMEFVGELGKQERPDWCPLVEVPTPHGRLIDADKVVNGECYFETIMDLEKAPTVIESEE